MSINDLLKNVIIDASRSGIPISDKIDSVIYVDENRYDRVAACYRYPFPLKYEIHLSRDTLRASRNEIKNIIAHEVLHTCFQSMDHGYPWQKYQKIMNDTLGYDIKVKYSWHKILKKEKEG